jgi:polyisoprenyl-teichoic acid--peptidoglycan teichoic acid transferase
MTPETPDPELEARLADALASARTDSRLQPQSWSDAPRRIVRASRRRRARHAAIAVSTVSALVLGTIGGAYLYVGPHLPQLQTTSLASIPGVKPVKGKGHLTAKPKTGQPFTMLILGTDSREGTGTKYGTNADACHCSDTIMLARVNPQTSKVSLMSVPRDVPITTDSGKRAKLNSAFAGGPDSSVAAIQKTLNIPINHWVVLDLAGFSSIVNATDGLKLDIPYQIRDKNAGLNLTTTGCQTLNGDEALAISRARELQYFKDGAWHYDPTWEYGRQRREQILLRVMAAHTAKKSLGNPITAARVISTLTSNDRLAVDNQVSTNELIDLAADFAGFDASAMKTFSLPTVTTKIAGQDYEVLQPNDDSATIQAWYDAVQPTAKPSTSGSPTTTAPPAAAPNTTSAAAPAVTNTKPAPAVTTTAGAAASGSAAATTIAPNEPKAWDPVPCS